MPSLIPKVPLNAYCEDFLYQYKKLSVIIYEMFISIIILVSYKHCDWHYICSLVSYVIDTREIERTSP